MGRAKAGDGKRAERRRAADERPIRRSARGQKQVIQALHWARIMIIVLPVLSEDSTDVDAETSGRP